MGLPPSDPPMRVHCLRTGGKQMATSGIVPRIPKYRLISQHRILPPQHISFAPKKAVKLVHHAKFKYIINKSMRQEIEFCKDRLCPNSGIIQEPPIAYVIPQTPTALTFGNSCLEGAEVTPLNSAFGGTFISQRIKTAHPAIQV